MKKLIVAMVILFMAVLSIYAQDTEEKKPCLDTTISLTLSYGMRNFSEDLYKTVYEDAATTIGIDLGFRAWKSLEIFVHTDILKKEGKMTFTEEETTLKITPLELGARFLIPVSKNCKLKLFPYLGAGVGYYMIKEEAPYEDVDEKKIGFFIEGGLRLYVIKSIFIDAKLKNVMVKSENDTSLGGFAYMGGIGFSF